MNFEEEVIAISHLAPVVVDFWAEWCGPCKVLGPVIEELAEEADGRWKLVKVDTEAETELSAKYRIKSIPAVKMFHKGEVIAEFTGALPKSQIEKWLSKHLPDERLDELETILERNDLDSLSDFVKQYPDLLKAKWELAKRLVKIDLERTEELLTSLKGNPEYLDKVGDLKAVMELRMWEGSAGPEAVLTHISNAKKALEEEDYSTALNELIQSIFLQKSYRNELARRVCISLFHQLGEQHEITLKYRKRFNMALY